MNIGGLVFEKAGEFIFKMGCLLANIGWSESKHQHFVYAHVVAGRVVYVGESSRTLLNRMYLYITHKGSTNVRVRTAHIADLQAGQKVEIYFYKPQAVLIDGVLSVNPYIGVEQALISKLKPILNRKDVGAKWPLSDCDPQVCYGTHLGIFLYLYSPLGTGGGEGAFVIY